jgi:hypothetical protein
MTSTAEVLAEFQRLTEALAERELAQATAMSLLLENRHQRDQQIATAVAEAIYAQIGRESLRHPEPKDPTP